ncbi:MAG: ABC transporter permease/substrate-binding protein [Clostridium sp.]|uniref:ABC transporter permease/substrate-binding protein n=1 Tax=Clostridium sp. TaxID=1506 RepID=UPI003F2C4581
MEFIKGVLNLYKDKSDFFLELIFEHLMLSTISIIIAAVIGISLGILISENKKLSPLIKGITNFLYTIPSIAILGFLVSISGVGNITAIITLSIYGLLPMVTNTNAGILNIDNNIIEAGRGMGTTKFQLLYKVKLPLAVPVIFSGFRNMAVMTIALCGIASFIGAGGLGVSIWRGITTNNTEMTIAGSILIAVIALIVDSLLSKIEKYLNYRTSNRRNKKRNITFKRKLVAVCILLISICLLIMNSFKNENKLVIASKPMTEQYILTEIIGQLVEEKSNIEVEIKKGIGGGTANIHPAIVKGEIDIYPEYTGTSWEYVLKNKPLDDNDKLYDELKKDYLDKYNLNWLNLYGYNSTYAIVMRTDTCEKYNIKTYSDLGKLSDELIFGAEYDFYEREDGYDSISKLYGFKFKDKLDLDMGLKYEALHSRKVDVITASTTDGKLIDKDYTVLEDDKRFFKDYFAGTVVREEALLENKELANILNLLEGKISEEDIIKMNYEVEVNKRDDKDIAREFLNNKGLID